MKPNSVQWRSMIITLIVVTALFAIGLSRLDIEADIVSFLSQGDSVISDALYIFKNHPIQDQLIIDVSLQEENLDLLVECGRRVEQSLRQSKLFKQVGLQDFQALIPDLAFHILNHLPLLFSTEDLQNQVEPLLDPQKVSNMISTVWDMAFNKIYLMTEGETLNELQLKGDRLVDMMVNEQQSGWLSSGFVSSMVFPGKERQQHNFAAWKKFWNPHRITELEKSIRDASLKLGFATDAFKPFFELLNASSYDPEAMVIPEKFFGLMGIIAAPEKKAWLQVSNLTTEEGYRAEAFYAKYGTLGKLFDPNYFSQNLGKLLFATFTKMLVIIGLSVTILLFLYFADLSLTLIALLPVLFALISTLATLNLIGHPLDIPGLMLAIIVVGMGIDYSLFFVRSYQRYGDKAHPYFGLIRMTVFLAGASTIIGFGVLCSAQHSLLRSAGITSLFGIGYSLVGAFIILPPLLKYRLRTREDDDRQGGSIRDRVLKRYRNLEAYPRLFARFKMHFDPMLMETDFIVDQTKPSDANGELVWLIATKENDSEKN